MQCLAFWEMQSAEYFVLSGRKIWVWWVGYLTRGREIPGSQCMSGFQRDCCLWKCQYSTTSKNQNFKASGVYILPLEIEGSVPSGTPHALTVRLGMGGGHLPGGVVPVLFPATWAAAASGAATVTHLGLMQRVVQLSAPLAFLRISWNSENVPGLPLYGSTLFAWCILYTHQSLSYFCEGFVHVVNFEGWGLFFFFQ